MRGLVVVVVMADVAVPGAEDGPACDAVSTVPQRQWVFPDDGKRNFCCTTTVVDVVDE